MSSSKHSLEKENQAMNDTKGFEEYVERTERSSPDSSKRELDTDVDEQPYLDGLLEDYFADAKIGLSQNKTLGKTVMEGEMVDDEVPKKGVGGAVDRNGEEGGAKCLGDPKWVETEDKKREPKQDGVQIGGKREVKVKLVLSLSCSGILGKVEQH